MSETDENTPIEKIGVFFKSASESEKDSIKNEKGESWSEVSLAFDMLPEDVSQEEAKSLIRQKRDFYFSYGDEKTAGFLRDYCLEGTKDMSLGSYELFAPLTPKQIEAVKNDKRITSVDFYDPKLEPTLLMNSSDQIVRSDDVRSAGYNGSGIKVGIIEESTNISSHIPNYSSFSNLITYATYSGYPQGSDPGGSSVHAANVVSVLHYVAPSAQIYLTKIHTLDQILIAINRLIDYYDVDIISLSVSSDYEGYNNVYFSNSQLYQWICSINSVIKETNTVICIANGNNQYEGYYDTITYINQLASPENIIAVGGVNSGSYTTPSNYNYSRAYMTSNGEYYVYSEQELSGQYSYDIVNRPDICAPCMYYDINNSTALEGTSFATPLTAGSIALLMDESSYLIGRQSLVKSILAASAKYSGYTASYLPFGLGNRVCWSDYEGVGVLNTYGAYYIRVNGRYTCTSVNKTATGPYTRDFTVTTSDSVIRVALTWLQLPPNQQTNGKTNFDLEVYRVVSGVETLIARNTHTIMLDSQGNQMNENLRVVKINPAVCGYGQYRIKVIYDNLVNNIETFSLSWY